jgi:murein DD-endopeptidase MepM/ murein hydrolase activator NlpD
MRRKVRRWLTCCAGLLFATAFTIPGTQRTASADSRSSFAGNLSRNPEPTIQTPRPTNWLPTKRGKCHRVNGIKGKLCDGPRRTPEPFGEEAFLAEELGLGTQKTAVDLLRHAPRSEWVDHIDGNASPSLLWPVERGSFGRGFGYTRKQRKSLRHNGVDVGADSGELVRSVNDGLVAYSNNEVSGFGNMVMVVHKDRSVSFYCHQRANYVFAGQQVKRGQVLGEVGSTGISRGPHLHFEWHVNGRARDPMPRMVGKQPRRGPLSDAPDHWL